MRTAGACDPRGTTASFTCGAHAWPAGAVSDAFSAPRGVVVSAPCGTHGSAGAQGAVAGQGAGGPEPNEGQSSGGERSEGQRCDASPNLAQADQ